VQVHVARREHFAKLAVVAGGLVHLTLNEVMASVDLRHDVGSQHDLPFH
jgi:hypothetical protein